MNFLLKESLTATESVEIEFSLSRFYIVYSLIFWLFISILLSGGIIHLGRYLAVWFVFYYGFYLTRANQYLLTNQRILVLHGWLNTKMNSINLEKITDMQIHQGFFERLILHSGTLFIETAGSHSPVLLRHIDSPYKLKKEIDEVRDKK